MTAPHLTPQPVQQSDQQPAVPEAFTHAPSYPPGMTLVQTLNDAGGLVHEVVEVAGSGRYRREFNTATGDSILQPLF